MKGIQGALFLNTNLLFFTKAMIHFFAFLLFLEFSSETVVIISWIATLGMLALLMLGVRALIKVNFPKKGNKQDESR